MASLRKENGRGRVGWRLQFRFNGKRHSLWLSDPSKRRAENVARHVDELVRAESAGGSLEPATSQWTSNLEGRLFESLAKMGLADPKRDRSVGDEGRLLGPFCDAYIKSRTDLKSGTLDSYKHAPVAR